MSRGELGGDSEDREDREQEASDCGVSRERLGSSRPGAAAVSARPTSRPRESKGTGRPQRSRPDVRLVVLWEPVDVGETDGAQ